MPSPKDSNGSRIDLNAALVFVRVIQAGSFSRAAKQIEMPVSTVSAKVAALEKSLCVSLIQRTTRRLHLTESGEVYFKHAVRAVGELQLAQTLTQEAREGVREKNQSHRASRDRHDQPRSFGLDLSGEISRTAS